MSWAPKSEVADYTRRASLDRVKLLPGGAAFVCESCLITCVQALLDYHHRIPQEAGGPDSEDNIAALCVGCHQFIHRLAMRLVSAKAQKQTPLTLAQQYAAQVNKPQAAQVVTNILMFAQLVAAYKVQKADNAIAPPDGAIMVAEMPNEFKALFKQIAWEIKRGDGRGIGMGNLAAIAVTQLIAKHRPELKDRLDIWVRDNILYPVEAAKQTWQALDEYEELSL